LNHTDSIQSSFLEQIKQKLPATVSLGDDLAEVLKVSRDSAYRRIRGETILSLDELKILCNHYGVSVDALISPDATVVSFRHQVVNNETFPFGRWLQYVYDNLNMISTFPEKELIYSAKDLLIFYLFKYPDVSAFKMFFWMKTWLAVPEYTNSKFNREAVPKEFLSLGNKIWTKYAGLPGVEIWSDESINATLRQIQYYWECDLFESQSQALQLCDQFIELLNEIEQHATTGKRPEGGTFKLYKNDIMIADNSVLFKMGDKRMAFVNSKILDFLSTNQSAFCEQTDLHLQKMINKSTQISATGERERTRFFNAMIEKIRNLKGQFK
jgi:hypothetical protein